MARDILDLTNVEAADSDYPYGRVKDNLGTNNGTPVNEAMLGDVLQFFNRLMALAGVTANSLPDNDYNGFQFMESLLTLTDRYKCTSSSSVAIGTGLKSFTVPANLDYATGTPVLVVDNASSLNYMYGTVFSYSGTALGVSVTLTGGSGTLSDWSIGLGIYNSNNIGVESGTSLQTKVVEIGDWDMVADNSIEVSHGIADFTKIRQVTAIIRSDSAAQQEMLNTYIDDTEVEGGIASITSTTIQLFRRTSGYFDGALYDSTSYNRGWLTIIYEE